MTGEVNPTTAGPTAVTTVSEIQADAGTALAETDSSLAGSQQVLSKLVFGVWGFAVIAMILWALTSRIGVTFICDKPTTPGVTASCTNAWISGRDDLKDIFLFAVLPFITALMGFYFGASSATKP